MYKNAITCFFFTSVFWLGFFSQLSLFLYTFYEIKFVNCEVARYGVSKKVVFEKGEFKFCYHILLWKTFLGRYKFLGHGWKEVGFIILKKPKIKQFYFWQLEKNFLSTWRCQYYYEHGKKIFSRFSAENIKLILVWLS